MELLQSGVDCAVIALWLGHESMDTTQSVAFSVIALWLGHESMITTHRYVEAADLAMKEKALAKLQEPETTMSRYHPADDALMQFLQSL